MYMHVYTKGKANKEEGPYFFWTREGEEVEMAPTHCNGVQMPSTLNSNPYKEITLNSRFTMPMLGLCLFRMDGVDVKDIFCSMPSGSVGYRHFDRKNQKDESLSKANTESGTGK